MYNIICTLLVFEVVGSTFHQLGHPTHLAMPRFYPTLLAYSTVLSSKSIPAQPATHPTSPPKILSSIHARHVPNRTTLFYAMGDVDNRLASLRGDSPDPISCARDHLTRGGGVPSCNLLDRGLNHPPSLLGLPPPSGSLAAYFCIRSTRTGLNAFRSQQRGVREGEGGKRGKANKGV